MQPINLPLYQPPNQSTSSRTSQSASPHASQLANQPPLYHSTNQLPPVPAKPTYQPASIPGNPPINLSLYQSTNPSPPVPANQSISPVPHNQPINLLHQLTNRPFIYYCVSTNQSDSLPIEQFNAVIRKQESTHKVPKSASQVVHNRTLSTLHATHSTPHGASRLVQAISARSAKLDMLLPGFAGVQGCIVLRLGPSMIAKYLVYCSTYRRHQPTNQ